MPWNELRVEESKAPDFCKGRATDSLCGAESWLDSQGRCNGQWLRRTKQLVFDECSGLLVAGLT